MDSEKDTEKISDFGLRLLEAFGEGASNKEIAKIMKVERSAVTNYLQGRIPSADKLQLVSNHTKYSIHWLITGQGDKLIDPAANLNLDSTFRVIVRQIVNEELDKRVVKQGKKKGAPSFTVNANNQEEEEKAA